MRRLMLQLGCPVRVRVISLACVLLALTQRSTGLYRSAGEILHFFSHAAINHPQKLKFEEVKLAAVPLPLVTISHFTPGVPEHPKHVAVLVFGEHAREVITTEVAVWLTKVLIGDVEEILGWPQMQAALRDAGVEPPGAQAALHDWSTAILQHMTLQVLPIENMDGRLLWETGELCWRKTRSHVDLNRNWDFAWQAQRKDSDMYGGEAAFSEPQTRFLRDKARAWRPAAFINVHSGEWAVYTPWDSRTTLGAGLPGDMEALIGQLSKLCDCMAGPAGGVSNYLAFGTSMDWMYTQLGVQYPLTVEVYGGGAEGKLRGASNPRLSSFNATSVDGPSSARRLLRQAPQAELDSVMKLLSRSSREKQACFSTFNPVDEQEYREVISRWVVIMLTTLKHVHSSLAAAA